MTKVHEYNDIQYRNDRAEQHGLVLVDDYGGRVDVRAKEEAFPGLVDGVVIFRADSMEEALLFIDGVLWHQDYVRIQGKQDDR